MKLVRWGSKGAEKPGVIDNEGRVRDLSGVTPDVAGKGLGAAALRQLAEYDLAALPLVPANTRLGPCVGSFGKIVCVGLNYSDHAAESNMPVPTEPVLFLKATSSLTGPNDDVLIPPGAKKVDWEVELGVVIGEAARNVPRERALDYVAGYCVVNDVSERAWQIERGGQWDKGKSYDTFAPLGPWLVTRDEVADPQALDMWLEVDGKRYQNGNTRTMIFDVATLVSYISQFMSLQPGDVISTGTPPGVGMGQKPEPIYLRAGQTMRLGVSGLGEQQQRLVAEQGGQAQ
ncbi:fumarylacetoacetate hydrolase family protein [Paraburkholderia sp. CNPSo 3281]|uniref:fumarylacetoacetate hydrolase family protein n=1 Tax=Paraburkholderia sp. CNPSo 3281 TaxID=2940933 RepID=UPI0020B797EA|nr:fumarylacetoacetate hydrolase family protein [Paraburkholderia sp. CNPSo 3281]MCP3716016.1 fumarylacetoacetate hydrolase family protein [Paraburkholderia sp. CNPSo 3281]